MTVLLLSGGSASAQLETITIETSEGDLSIELFDFPDVVLHSKFFLEPNNLVRLRNAFFHRGDKLRFCDASYCFYCICTAELVCQADPNERTCETAGDEFFIVDDQTEPAPYIETGRFYLDDDYAIKENANNLPPALQSTPPTFSNRAFTVAYVRDEDTKLLTSEWIINLEDNPELDDPFGDDPTNFSDAYLVFGAVRLGQDVASGIGALKTYDARQDPTVIANATPSPEELEQVPVFEAFNGEPGSGDTFIDPCAPGDTACSMPACSEVTSDGVACVDPRCVALVPLTDAEQEQVDNGEEVPRFCATPVLPAFPILIPEPRALVGEVAALAALGALAAGSARRRRRTR